MEREEIIEEIRRIFALLTPEEIAEIFGEHL